MFPAPQEYTMPRFRKRREVVLDMDALEAPRSAGITAAFPIMREQLTEGGRGSKANPGRPSYVLVISQNCLPAGPRPHGCLSFLLGSRIPAQ